MNELILPIIFAVSLGFVAGVIALLVYLDSQSKKTTCQREKTKNLPPVYTEEEIELAQFLEKGKPSTRHSFQLRRNYSKNFESEVIFTSPNKTAI